jgi:hypothetical protein
VPTRVRSALERWWGRRVVSAESIEGGFSPGVAARLRGEDGARLFVKAASAEPNPTTPTIHRREIEIASRLPESVPAPRLRWWLDEGGAGWVLLAFDDLDGISPETPWRAETVARVIDALSDLERALTPNPLPQGVVAGADEVMGTDIAGWHRLQHGGPTHRPLDRWSAQRLEAMAALEVAAAEAAAGDTLLHFDLRADNMVATAERIWFVDWPHAHVGAPWLDPLLMAPSVAMQGGPDPEALLKRLPSYRAADPDAVTASVAAIAGFFTRTSLQPDPPGLPTVRAFQAAQGAVARRWLAERLGWERP